MKGKYREGIREIIGDHKKWRNVILCSKYMYYMLWKVSTMEFRPNVSHERYTYTEKWVSSGDWAVWSFFVKGLLTDMPHLTFLPLLSARFALKFVSSLDERGPVVSATGRIYSENGNSDCYLKFSEFWDQKGIVHPRLAILYLRFYSTLLKLRY